MDMLERIWRALLVLKLHEIEASSASVKLDEKSERKLSKNMKLNGCDQDVAGENKPVLHGKADSPVNKGYMQRKNRVPEMRSEPRTSSPLCMCD